MATCPHCKGHLTDSHRCPRSPAKVAIELTLAALAGGFLGLVVASLIDPGGHLLLDALWVFGGAIVGAGVDKVLRS